jgi:predicted MFS family arabinose efflux permease
MNSNLDDAGGRSSDRLILLALFISSYAMYPSQLIITVLLVEIAGDFNLPLGISAQIRSVSLAVALVTAFAVGALSIKYRKKNLLIAGLIAMTISAIGCVASMNFDMLILFYILTGLGVTMVGPMATALVGEHFPAEERASALGWYGAAGGISHIVGSQVIGLIAEHGGWRLPFLAYALPVSLLSIALVSSQLPPEKVEVQRSSRSIVTGFRNVLSDRSALACLTGIMLATATWQGIYFFSVSFVKQELSMPPILAAGIYSIMSAFFTIGSLSSGRIIGKIGRKPAVLLGLAAIVIFTVAYTNLPLLWFVLFCNVVGCYFGAIRNMSSLGLSLEQVSGSRGTMMSLNSAAMRIGSLLGTSVGGLIIIVYGWRALGLLFGFAGILSALIYLLFVRDPI